MSNFPQGTSLRNLDHFRQIIASKKYQKYDFSISYTSVDKDGEPCIGDPDRNRAEYYSSQGTIPSKEEGPCPPPVYDF